MECQCPDQKVGGGALLLGFVLVVWWRWTMIVESRKDALGEGGDKYLMGIKANDLGFLIQIHFNFVLLAGAMPKACDFN